MAISQLDIFQAYDYLNTLGAKRELKQAERIFYEYCILNHEDICNEDEKLPQHIREKATELYELI